MYGGNASTLHGETARKDLEKRKYCDRHDSFLFPKVRHVCIRGPSIPALGIHTLRYELRFEKYFSKSINASHCVRHRELLVI
jgi:hypothetical protein